MPLVLKRIIIDQEPLKDHLDVVGHKDTLTTYNGLLLY